MAILGLDYGDRKIGLAKGDLESKVAVPLMILENKGWNFLLKELKEICQKEDIKEIVVGIPLSLSAQGKSKFFREVDLQNQQTKKVLAFIDFLKINLTIPILMEDERLTTKMANGLRRGLIKEKGKEDAVAAMLILQSHLDKINSKSKNLQIK